MLVVGLVLSVTVVNINTIPTHAITQDEMIEMIRERNEEYGINMDDLKATGGTANDAGGEALTQKMEEIQNNEAPAPTKAPEPTPVKEEPKEVVAEPTVAEPIEEPTTIEEIETTEEPTTEEITTEEEPTTIEEPDTIEEATIEESTIEESTEEVEEPTTKNINTKVVLIIALLILMGVVVGIFLIHRKNDKK